MSPPSVERLAVRVIRFSPLVALQCGQKGRRIPDWAVCDTIANGARHATGRRGEQGGRIVRFEKTYIRTRKSAGRSPSFVRVCVLAELTPKACLALAIQSPPQLAPKIWDQLGFFIRAGSK
jgi:hypothetical protein